MNIVCSAFNNVHIYLVLFTVIYKLMKESVELDQYFHSLAGRLVLPRVLRMVNLNLPN